MKSVVSNFVCLFSSKGKEISPPNSGQLSPVIQTMPIQVPVSTLATEVPIGQQPLNVTSNVSHSLTSSSSEDSPVGVMNVPPAVPPLLRQLPFGLPASSECLSLFSNSGFPSTSCHLKSVVQQPLNLMGSCSFYCLRKKRVMHR